MGNWRMIEMSGTVDPAEGKRIHEGVIELSRYVVGESSANRRHREAKVGFTVSALRYGSTDVTGWFWNWETGRINECGNLFERNYDPDAVLRDLVALAAVAPSLDLAVHCGGEWERNHCVATIRVKDGAATLGPPETPFVGIEIPESLEAVLLEPVRVWLAARSYDDLEYWERERRDAANEQ